MRKSLKITFITCASMIGLFFLFIFFDSIFGNGKILLPVKQKEKFSNEHVLKFPSMLRVQNNEIINSSGKVILLKGIMAPDPQKLDLDDNFKQSFYKKLFKTGGNVIRVPVHPDRWENDKYYLWRYLDHIVSWAGENNYYVIIDLHFIGNIATGDGDEMPDINETPKDFTLNFWRKIANYFKDVPNVIFEIYNEPALISPDKWYECANEIVATIRQIGAEQLIIVGGSDYSYDLSWVKDMPILDHNIAYATHVYPTRSNWNYYFGDIAKKYPVIVTEWGFMDENRKNIKNEYLIGDVKSFGDPFLEYLGENNIGWIACWYDDRWEPPMYIKNLKDTTNYGKFVFTKLKDEKK